MHSIFSPDSKIMLALTGLADLMILNLLFVATCIPVFTIGAASSALYTVCFRMIRQEEGHIISGYLRSFRENFRQGTVIWLILLLLAAVGALNLGWLDSIGGLMQTVMRLLTVMVLAILAFIHAYVFPLQSQFRNTVKVTLSNAFLLSIGHLPRTMLITVLNLFPLGLLAVNLYTFLDSALVWFVIYFSGTAFLNSLLLKKVFAPYMNPQ